MVHSATAATFVWDGGTTGGGTGWLVGTNWNPDIVPDAGPGTNDLAIIEAGSGATIGINANSPATNNGPNNQAIGQILYTGGINRTINNSSTVADGVLTLNGISSVLLSNTSKDGLLTFANGAAPRLMGIVLATSGDIHTANTNSRITINNIISEIGGARGLNKTGLGTLTLSGANTFTGNVAVDNGTLSISTLANTGAAQSLGTSAGAVTLGSATTAATLTYTGAAATTNRNFSVGINGATLSHANNITYSGTISGSGPLTKAGAGTLTVNGAGVIGGLTIDIAGGTVRLDNAITNSNNRLDDSTTVAMSGGTLQFDGNRDVPTAEVASQLFIGSNGNTIRTTAVGAAPVGDASISFAGLSRSTRATVAFDIATGVNVHFASSTLSNGIIGGWALAGSDFATVDSGTGNVTPYTSTVSNTPALWGSADNVKLTASATVSSATNINSLQLADDAGAPVTLTTDAMLAMGSGGVIASAVSGHTIAGTGSITSLGNELFIHVPNAAHTLNVNAAVSDNGINNVDLVTTGPGVTLLNAANTLNGYAQINSGTLGMGAGGTLTNNTVNVTSAGTFALNGQTKTIGGLSGSGAVTLGGGALSAGNNNSSTTFAGVISGNGNVTKVGTGTLTLTGVNTFVGATDIGPIGGTAGGVLVIDADSRLGAAPAAATPGRINLYNATLRLADGIATTGLITSGGPVGTRGVLISVNRGVTLNAGGGKIDVPTGNYAEIPGIIADGASGTSPLHKIGGGILDLRTAVSTFTGGVIVDGGTLGVSADRNLGAVPGPAVNPAAVQLNNGATIKWYSNVGQLGFEPTRGLTIGAGGGVIDYAFSSGTPSIRHPITSAVGNTLTKIGTNTVLSTVAQPAMNGDLHVNQGRWNAQVSGSAGNGTIFLNAPNISPATAAGVAQLGIGGTNVGATVTLTNNVVLNPTGLGATGFEVNVSTPTQNELILNGQISGTGGLTKGRVAGTNGILTLAGTNTYSGDTTVLFGTLRTLGGAAIPDSSTVVMGAPAAVNSANLEIAGSETIGGLTGGGPVTGNVKINTGQTLTINQAADTTFAGTITGGNLVKSGAGKLTLRHVRGGGDVTVSGGAVAVTPSSLADGVSNIGALTIGASNTLDLTDNKLITTSAAGTATEGVYDGVQGQVQSAYNFGSWNGPGLTTSTQLALDGIATVGVATGEQIRGLGPTDTDVWAGQTINGASTIAMYTYAGDANLDGQVDAGDYGILDAFIQVAGATGYGNGDFNYDGFIDAADYGTIDNSIQFQGPPIFTSGGASASTASLSGVTAVPEPASLSVLAVATASLLGRRRRRVQ